MRITCICNHLQSFVNNVLFRTIISPDFSNFAINSLSTLASTFSDYESESDDSESDFNSVFMSLDICIFFTLCLHSSK